MDTTQPTPHPARFLTKIRLTLDMIKFEHSVFALPFALTAALLAVREQATPSTGIAWKLVWIVAAMISARSAAMTFNRIVDQAIDADNPRTRTRHLPRGALSRRFAWGFFLAAVTLFLASSAMLNRLCLQLAPLALGVVLLYSYTKRFTSWCHVVLGFALGIAPPAAWIAVAGSLDPRILWLTAAVMFWTAGFDIIYASQDYEFDGSAGLFSLPRRFGIAGALWISRLFHVLMVVCLLMLFQAFDRSWIALAGIACVAALLLYEHSLVKSNDLSRVDAAFFTVNGYVSVLFFMFWTVDLFMQ